VKCPFSVVILKIYQQNNASLKGGGLALGRSENPRVGSSILSLGTSFCINFRIVAPGTKCDASLIEILERY